MSKANWQTVRFGDMAQHIGERVQPDDATVDRYVGLEHLDPESLKIRRWGSPDDVGATKLHFYPGDIIFGKRRFYQRKLAVADFEGICSAHAMVLRAKPDIILPEFLPFFMQSETFFERAMSISVGSLSPTINWSTLQRQEFALPPLDEQRRIAEVLTAVEDTKHRFEDVLYKVVYAKKGCSYRLFNYGVNQQTNFEGTPSHWRTTELINFSSPKKNSFVNGPFGSNLLTSELTESGVPVIYVRDIKQGKYERVSESHVKPEKAKELAICNVTYGDILVAKVGDPPGDAAPYFDQNDSIVTQDVIRIRPAPDVDTMFMIYMLNSHLGKKVINQILITGTRQRFSLTEYKKSRFPKPPLSEQRAIVSILEQFDRSIQHIEEYIIHLSGMQKQLIKKYLQVP
jgi:type I restriction enzyme, S subunit